MKFMLEVTCFNVSGYEPCGLSQMIAMRFGTIPIVRELVD